MLQRKSPPQGSDGLPPPHLHLPQPVHLADLDPSSNSLQPWYGQSSDSLGKESGLERAWDKPWAGRFERGAGTQHWEGEEARSPEGWVSPSRPAKHTCFCLVVQVTVIWAIATRGRSDQAALFLVLAELGWCCRAREAGPKEDRLWRALRAGTPVLSLPAHTLRQSLGVLSHF